MKGSKELRKLFIDFFAKKGHQIKESETLYPKSDPTILFTNAGMVPFKQYWMEGQEVPFDQVVSIQKCLRGGGKKSDLENVGVTLRHHSFFEMLGNFSFKGYFKREAIEYAWEFLTQELGIDAQYLWVSVYQEDEESYQIWKDEIKVDPSRIVHCGKEDNFWGPVGQEGVCGPCSEIHIDLQAYKNNTKPRTEWTTQEDVLVELWNLVFIQYFQDSEGQLQKLVQPGIDTGMGLERLALVMDSKAENTYQTDLFFPIIKEISQLAGVEYQSQGNQSRYFHIIADHIRGLVIALAEGLSLSSEGRGYVLRRLLRKASLSGYQLGIQQVFLTKLVAVVGSLYGKIYPEVKSNQKSIEQMIEQEEIAFRTLLKKSEQLLKVSIERSSGQLQGREIYYLYDTHGVPLDVIKDIAEYRKVDLDIEGFEKCLAQQRHRGRSDRKNQNIEEQLFREVAEYIQQNQPTEFIGYQTLEGQGKIQKVWWDDTDKTAKKSVYILFDKTPFYGKSGGQEGDTGWIVPVVGQDGQAKKIQVLDTIKPHHQGIVLKCSGEGVHKDQLQGGATWFQQVDYKRRFLLSCHHSATHIVHAVLKDVLGDHIRQMGSLVAEDRLRFDFSHTQKLSNQELEQINNKVNQAIVRNEPRVTEECSLEQAKQTGAIAFFDEKYGSKVRVVSFGELSKECCGGTHVNRTGEIGVFQIINQTAIGTGVRRIEAVVSVASEALYQSQKTILEQVAQSLKCEPQHIVSKINSNLAERKKLQQTIQQQGQGKINQKLEQIVSQDWEYQNQKYIIAKVEAEHKQELLKWNDKIKEVKPEVNIILWSQQAAGFLILVSMTKKWQGAGANQIIKEICQQYSGRGGGNPKLAQAQCSLEPQREGIQKICQNL